MSPVRKQELMVKNMSDIMLFLLAGMGTAMAGLWIFLYIRYRHQYDAYLKVIDPKQFFMAELFFIGFGAIALFKINLNTTRYELKKKKIAEIRGRRYAEFFNMIILSGQITYILTIVPFSLFVACLADSILFGGLGIAGGLIVAFYLDVEINNAVEKRRDNLLADFPKILSQLALLTNAGLPLKDALYQVALSGAGEIYEEMKSTVSEIENGASTTEAMLSFANRCNIKEIRKFVSILVQNLQKGNRELAHYLHDMARDAWVEKKHMAKRKGEMAGQKLMLPIGIMFLGIVLMIIIPILSGIVG
jgi:tight adherence protein C